MSDCLGWNGGEGAMDDAWAENIGLSDLEAWADALKLSNAEAETVLSAVMAGGTAVLRMDRWLERITDRIERTVGRIERRTELQLHI